MMNSSEDMNCDERNRTEHGESEQDDHQFQVLHPSSFSSDFDEQTKLQKWHQLEERIRLIEYATFYPDHYPQPSRSEHEQVIRARKAVVSLKLYSARFKWVPDQYYSQPLSQRAKILGAHSTRQLCKSMLMENKAFDPCLIGGDKEIPISNRLNPLYSQFYLVILQYDATISMKKLQSEVRALMPLNKRFEPSKFDFRVASEQDNDRLTGFMHNAVTPLGMTENVPMILAKAIGGEKQMTQFIWMGGGHVHLKLGVAVTELVDLMKPFVLDVTEPRLDDLHFSE